MKTHRLLDGAAEIGPDGVARGSLPSYADILVNNGVSRAAIDRLLADVAEGRMTRFRGLGRTQALSRLRRLRRCRPAAPHHARRQERCARRSGRPGRHSPIPYFSLENLLVLPHRRRPPRRRERRAHRGPHGLAPRAQFPGGADPRSCTRTGATSRSSRPRRSSRRPQYQRVVFTEFAEAMSGGIPGPSHGFGGYDPDVNPGISDEFAGAMYRVGHSMINETIPYVDGDGQHAGGAAVLGLPEPGHVRRRGSAHRRRRRRGRHHRRRASRPRTSASTPRSSR